MKPSDYKLGVDDKGIYALNRRTGEKVRARAVLAYFLPECQSCTSEEAQTPEQKLAIHRLNGNTSGSYPRNDGEVSDR